MIQEPGKISSRKKFLIWATALVSTATVFKFIPHTKSKKADTVKMLTQDGKLVEIDKKFLVPTGKKINEKDLKIFVKHKYPQL
ncbi:MAG: hypothetical protein ABJA57_06150 [Ginsengibacter sp.]